MDRQEITRIGRNSMASRKEVATREVGHLFRHGMRVGLMAEKIAVSIPEAAGLNLDVLFCAGLFHDVGKGREPHGEVGAQRVREQLRDACTPEDLDHVSLLICQHNRRHQPNAPLAVQIVQDADVLDHVGTHAIWMGCLFNGYKELGPEGLLRFYYSPENERYQQALQNGLNLDLSRRLFIERLAAERTFMQRFREEMAGSL